MESWRVQKLLYGKKDFKLKDFNFSKQCCFNCPLVFNCIWLFLDTFPSKVLTKDFDKLINI